MADACLCGQGFNNTGIASCFQLFKKTTGFFLVPLIANDGTKNKIDLSTTIDILALTKLTDKSKRLYPVQGLKDVELPQAESKFETFKDGSKYKLADGIKSFKAVIPEVPSAFVGKLQGVSCTKFGVYLFDIDGNLRGLKDGTDLYPIEIGGWDAIYQDTNEDGVAKAMIQFDFDILLKVSKYWILSAEDLGANPNTIDGLLDVTLSEVSSGTTSSVVNIYSDYGNGILTNPAPVVGLVTADFSAYNDTDALAVTVTVAESTTIDGQYTITYTAQTAADLVTFKVLPASGFEGEIQVTI